MAHIKNGICEGIKQVIADHDPDRLQGLRALGHGKEQDARNGQQRRGQQQPRTGLALFCMRAINKIAHDYVRDRVDNLGHDGKYDQKCAAPESGQLQYICIIDVQVRRQHSIEQQRTRRANQIPQPLLRRFYIL